MGFNGFIQFIVWTIITLGVICSGQFYNTRPYPTYSLENMPKTGFTCRDKILGGYYADPETQCQMFHVCVKVAGVGVQDYRFLCPNATAFDQEAQICANWGDVDCEASTLYYGSDNFDLYRIGNNFDSKRAPYADEDEATFHLQRAETGDARRSKQVVVDQFTKSENSLIQNANSFRDNSYRNPVPVQSSQAPSQERYTENTTPAGTYRQSIAANYNYNQNVNTSPAVKYTSTTARTVAPVNSQSNSNNQYEKESQKQTNYNNYNANNDEIFHRSQSSHFYNNRNNGKEEYEQELTQSKTTTTTTSRPQTRTGRNRGRGNVRANNINGIYTDSKRTSYSAAETTPSTTTTTSTTQAPQYNAQKVQSARVRTNYNQYIQPTTSTTTSTTSAPEKFYDAYNTALQLQQQQQLAVQHYKNFPPSTTINPAELKKTPATFDDDNYEPQHTTSSSSNLQYYNTNRNQQSARNQNVNKAAAQEFSSTFAPVQSNQDQQTTDENQALTPRGFSKSSNDGQFNQYQVGPNIYLEKYQTLKRGPNNNGNENYTPASTFKKFSTLVPKDQYSPTTFKPNTYKKPIEPITQAKQGKHFAPRFNPDSYFDTAVEPTTTQRIAPPAPVSYTTTTTTTTTTSTSRPQAYATNVDDIDEDDGQYHPELYEKDFAKNKISQKQRNNARQQNFNNNNYNNNYNYNQSPASESSGEDEFLKTAHSQNIAASKLQTLTQQNQQKQTQKSTTSNNPLYDSKPFAQKPAQPIKQAAAPPKPAAPKPVAPKLISNAPTISPNIKTTKKPAKKEKDASYDYAYYDSGNSHDFSEYELIEEFSKTAKKLSKN